MSKLEGQYLAVQRAIGNPAKNRILKELSGRVLTSEELANEIGVRRQTVEYHLKELVSLGLVVKGEREGRVAYQTSPQARSYLDASFDLFKRTFAQVRPVKIPRAKRWGRPRFRVPAMVPLALLLSALAIYGLVTQRPLVFLACILLLIPLWAVRRLRGARSREPT